MVTITSLYSVRTVTDIQCKMDEGLWPHLSILARYVRDCQHFVSFRCRGTESLFFMILLENQNFSFFQVILTSQVHINKSITGAFLLPWLGDGLLLSAGWQ